MSPRRRTNLEIKMTQKINTNLILYLKEESKFSEFLDFVYYSEISRQNGSDPFISEKKMFGL